MAHQQSLIIHDVSFMVFDQILGQLDSNTFDELIILVDLPIILNNGDLLAGDVVIGKVDVIGGDGVPVE